MEIFMEEINKNHKLNPTVETLIQLYSMLPEEQKGIFFEQILKDIPKSVADGWENPSEKSISKEEFLLEAKTSGHTFCCPHCGCVEVVKYGKKNGRQRFKCNACGKTFSLTTGTVLYHSKLDLATWKKYLWCMTQKYPLRRCAQECGIRLKTAFFLRHKILDTLRNMQEKVKLNGIVEADETFFTLSFKGHHGEGDFKMPRKSKARGEKASEPGLGREQVCVSGGINLNGLSVAKVTNLGKPKLKHLLAALRDKVDDHSLLVTDSFSAYRGLSKLLDLIHVRIPSGSNSCGVFNIQKMNSYHSHLKRLVNRHFCGVATKYLNNYIVYHNFINYSKGTVKRKWELLVDWSLTNPIEVTYEKIRGRNPIPVLEGS